MRHDLVTGHLDCNENTSAILASYIVQSVIGDFYYQVNNEALPVHLHMHTLSNTNLCFYVPLYGLTYYELLYNG